MLGQYLNNVLWIFHIDYTCNQIESIKKRLFTWTRHAGLGGEFFYDESFYTSWGLVSLRVRMSVKEVLFACKTLIDLLDADISKMGLRVPSDKT